MGDADAGVEEHRFLCEVLEAAATFDQVNCGELVSMENVARRLQIWEEAYSKDLLAANTGGEADDSMWVEERRLFSGAPRARHGALVCPKLEKHVAERLAERAALLKEKRKGREEHILAKPLGGGLAAEPKGRRPKGGGRGNGG